MEMEPPRACRLTGRMRMEVRDRTAGPLCADRRSGNIVVQQGAEIVARLAAGVAAARPINRVQVGFGRETVGPEARALTPPPAVPALAPEALRAAIAADAFEVDTASPGVVRLRIRTLFRPTVDLPEVSEAGLFAEELLYNQVVFEPLTLKANQEITFFWEIDFPYGR